MARLTQYLRYTEWYLSATLLTIQESVVRYSYPVVLPNNPVVALVIKRI